MTLEAIQRGIREPGPAEQPEILLEGRAMSTTTDCLCGILALPLLSASASASALPLPLPLLLPLSLLFST